MFHPNVHMNQYERSNKMKKMLEMRDYTYSPLFYENNIKLIIGINMAEVYFNELAPLSVRGAFAGG